MIQIIISPAKKNAEHGGQDEADEDEGSPVHRGDGGLGAGGNVAVRFCGGVQYLAGTASLPSPLSPAEEKALLARMAAGEADARDALILHNLRLVVYLAKKYENSGVPAEDLISIGTIGLIKAVNTFTPERSIKLATYASRCIGNEILMYLRKSSNRRQSGSSKR